MKPSTYITTGLALVATISFAVAISGPSKIEGFAQIIDGDTLRVGGRTIRLLGIDAPEMGQPCNPFVGQNNIFDCGMKARVELRDFISNRTIECALRGRDAYSRDLGFCSVDGHDLGRFMITRGWAVTYGDSGYKYVSDERSARAERTGLWSTFFDRPSEFRQRLKLINDQGKREK